MNKLDEYEDRSALAGEWISFWITLVILSLLGAVASLVIGEIFVMGSDGCLGGGTRRFLCTEAGQQTVFWLPWLGWAGAIASSLVTARAARLRRGSPWLGILIGGLVYVVAVVVAYSITAP